MNTTITKQEHQPPTNVGPLQNVFTDIYQQVVRRPNVSALPLRVFRAIRERERTNEVLARLIQLAIIIFFSVIFVISPKTSPDEAFSPVPYVLATYFCFSVFGLIWAIRARLPDWSVYGSILFDFGLLYGLLISFHIQYMQPASFTLKAPALMYVFIFITIRALRFEPKFVVASGMVAATGWLAVIFYVINVDPQNAMRTHSYVEYLTSNTILIGAEVDKIVSIALVTAILALAVRGSNNLLVQSAAEKTAADDFSRFFDKSTASDIRNAQANLQAGEGEKRQATIMNVDLRGFTIMASDMDASMVMRVLSAYQNRTVAIIHDHGGAIDKFMGDGIMATFGIAGRDDQPAAGALDAAEAILNEARQWPQSDNRLLRGLSMERIGIGIASGEVAYGAVGGTGRLEMTVIGAAVNLSAKLEKHNKQLATRCLCDGETYDLALQQGYRGQLTADRIKTQVDGVNDPRQVVKLGLS